MAILIVKLGSDERRTKKCVSDLCNILQGAQTKDQWAAFTKN